MKTLFERSITSVSWNAAANGVTVGVLFIRSVLLARILPIETFGIYAGATAVVGLTAGVASFGMGAAFLHRAPQTADEEQTARVHFTLKLLLTFGWACIMLTGTLCVATGPTRTALLLLIATSTAIHLAETPRLLLVRRVEHRRLALMQIATAITTTAIAITLALRGVTLWALLATDAATAVVMLGSLYLWRPVWRPRFAWTADSVRHFLHFGSRAWAAGALQTTIDNLDDLWTRLALGTTALGLYSRAYTFATYPRRFLAIPVASVVGGTYAEIANDPERLSRSFSRVNALMARAGFLAAGALVLVAPEFIRLLLGEKWLPMLLPFRVMLVFAMLDPLKSTIIGLFPAVGRPDLVVRAGALQLAILLSGLAIATGPLGVEGVALAASLAVIAGTFMLLLEARHFVRFSVIRLLAPPALALTLGSLSALAAGLLAASSDLLRAALKLGVFLSSYATILALVEGRELLEAWREVRERR